MSDATRSFFDRTWRHLRRAWHEVAGSTFGARGTQLDPDLPQEDLGRLRQQMQACLDGRGGEVSARARAAGLGRAYLSLNPDGRQRF